jgi:antitoxin PrlF
VVGRYTQKVRKRQLRGLFEEGDEIAYEIKENLVILTKASPKVVSHPIVTFDEWLSEADRKSYARL